ncbi:MAG TPA: prephenate dehydrogenase/arogenate dehydrogenase family protein [Longimicrobium sp.]|nr:prephenate dehydrogenase/arogenate dehydrogenase family protein [Longimicrobium sp.]
MSAFRTAAVVGLGLIGGSVARALAAGGARVLGWDRDPAAVRDAMAEGVVHGALAEGSDGIESAELVVIAVPVDAAGELLARLAPRLGGALLVTDVGSTKASVVRAAEAAGIGDRFVGSHPLAGDHRSGWGASREELFRGARVFLSPTTTATDAALRHAEALWRELGAATELIDAGEHDRRLAATSHLPQLVATALAAVLAGRGAGREELGPGGRDMTRLAGSSPEMWTAIASDNAEPLAAAVAELEHRLREIRAALDANDRPAVRRFLEDGKRWFGEGAG